MPQKSLRGDWVKAKAQAAKSFDLSKLVDKEKFGPKLDKFQATFESYEKLMKKLATNPDDNKEKAAKNAVKAAAVAARDAADKYIVALRFLEKSSTGATKSAADKLGQVLTMHILPTLNKAANGNFNDLD